MAEQSPKKLLKKLQHRPRLTVWEAITADGLIGPVIFRDTMNAETYLKVLEDNLIPSLRDIDQDQDMIFNQDGVPPHYARAVHQFLNDKLPVRLLEMFTPFMHFSENDQICSRADCKKVMVK